MNANEQTMKSMQHLPDDYTITRADLSEITQLIAVDQAANELFRGSSLLKAEAMDDHVPAEIFTSRIESGDAFVVRAPNTAPVGFTITSPRKRSLYLDQISVDPAYGKKGLGRALIANVLADARSRKFRRVTLSTFRDLPWNGPFYASCGFREIPRKKLTDWMLKLEEIQSEDLDVSARCFMECKTSWL